MTRIIWNALAALIITTAPLSAAEVVTYYHNDHLGSPIAATDSTGAVVWQQAYDPWGFKLTANTDERIPTSAATPATGWMKKPAWPTTRPVGIRPRLGGLPG
ncbi:MAG: hypothetical protein DSY83_13765 [Flavobacteriia bacterium]|nr:MAG: hypothetical protein DSY83_13765 [Flavobacteriia bacterium]